MYQTSIFELIQSKCNSDLLRVVELFAGIGSQTQALKNIGIEHEVVGISEIDPYAVVSYKAIHGDVPNFGDITQIECLPDADLWTYSFPCTDISLAGKQQGLGKGSGTRSGLLWEVERLLIVAKENGTLPKYLLLENVKNLVGKKFKGDFDSWIDFLSSLGYHTYYKVLNAKNYGIPQNRERVFAVSCLDEIWYEFPHPKELKLKLKDMLDRCVDEKYYLSDEQVNAMLESGFIQRVKHLQEKDVCDTICARDYKEPHCVRADKITIKNYIKNIRSVNGIMSTLGTNCGSATSAGGGVVVLDRTYLARKPRIYKNICPTLRSERNFEVIEYEIGAMRGRKQNHRTKGHFHQTLELNQNGISNTLTTVQKDNLVIEVKSNNRKGYEIAGEGDSIDINYPTSKTRRGRVQYGISHTITCNDKNLVVVKHLYINRLRIRRLLSLECWRLMGFHDQDFYKAKDALNQTFYKGNRQLQKGVKFFD